MNKNQQEALESLRNAAEQDEWNICREMIGILLPQLNSIAVMKLIARQAQEFLSDLSHLHPQDEELVKAVELFNNITSLEALNEQGQLTHALLKNYWKWPGVSNFRNALKGISKPEQYYEHAGEYKDTIVSLVSAILMAIGTNAYWGGNPEFSKTFFGPNNQDILLMLVKGDRDPTYIEIRKSLWTEIVDEIETLLQAEDLQGNE